MYTVRDWPEIEPEGLTLNLESRPRKRKRKLVKSIWQSVAYFTGGCIVGFVGILILNFVDKLLGL